MPPYYHYESLPYLSVAERRLRAQIEIEQLRKQGRAIAPVIIEGRGIAATFWGKAWCENLESYHDFESRLPRGRSYVRNRAVLDLQIAPLAVTALVMGSSTYKVSVRIAAVPKAQWQSICRDCAGGIDSLVELLRGRFSKAVMERVCRQGRGLFPRPSEITFSCSCPDFASMCKHVAAALYGVGARLDEMPELLFRLRAVDEKDLLAHMEAAVPLSAAKPAAAKLLDADDISALFGLEMAVDEAASSIEPRKKTRVRLKRVEPEPKVSKSKIDAAKTVRSKRSAPPATAKRAAPRPIVQAAAPAKRARKGDKKTEAPTISSPNSRAEKPGSKKPRGATRRQRPKSS
jgi:uncharacterized Zn finger protein